MTEPTEAEVEAATKVIEDLLNRYGENVFDYAAIIARAALTAAAQVRREQAVRDKIAMHDKAMKDDLGPLPIYGTTEAPSEPDYGPDVFGERLKK